MNPLDSQYYPDKLKNMFNTHKVALKQTGRLYFTFCLMMEGGQADRNANSSCGSKLLRHFLQVCTSSPCCSLVWYPSYFHTSDLTGIWWASPVLVTVQNKSGNQYRNVGYQTTKLFIATHEDIYVQDYPDLRSTLKSYIVPSPAAFGPM